MTKPDKIQLKVVEIGVNEFKPGSKYLIIISPEYGDMVEGIHNLLVDIGVTDVAIVPLPLDAIRVYSIPEDQSDHTT